MVSFHQDVTCDNRNIATLLLLSLVLQRLEQTRDFSLIPVSMQLLSTLTPIRPVMSLSVISKMAWQSNSVARLTPQRRRQILAAMQTGDVAAKTVYHLIRSRAQQPAMPTNLIGETSPQMARLLSNSVHRQQALKLTNRNMTLLKST